MPRVSIILVTWNSLDYLPRCFEHIEAQTFRDVEIIAVDNGSTDGSLEWLRSSRRPVRVIENGTNRGFCVANNQGIAAAQGEHVLLLNTDVWLDPRFIETLVDDLDADPGLGAAGGKLLRPAPKRTSELRLLDTAGETILSTLRLVNRGEETPDDGRFDRREEVFGVSAAAALYRRAMLDDVAVDGEFLDSRLFSYLEDSDLNWRARLRGWRILYDPAATGTHVRQHATSRSRTIQRHALANRWVLLVKNATGRDLLRCGPAILVYETLRLARTALRSPALLPAYALALGKLPAALRHRRTIQSRRRAPIDHLRPWLTPESWIREIRARLPGAMPHPAHTARPATASDPTGAPEREREPETAHA